MAAIGVWIQDRCVCGEEYEGPTAESIAEQKAKCKKCADKADIKKRLEAANMFAPRGIHGVCHEIDKVMNKPIGELAQGRP